MEDSDWGLEQGSCCEREARELSSVNSISSQVVVVVSMELLSSARVLV